MKIIALAFAFLMVGFGSCSVKAQTPQTVNIAPSGVMASPNLIYMTTNPNGGPTGTSPGSWSSFAITTTNGGGISGGNQPAYNTSTGTFMFGYTQQQVAYTYALSQALRDSGMTWTGYNYSWDYINQDFTKGTLAANLSFNTSAGTSLYSKSWTLGTTTNGWTTMSGTESFTSPGLAAANLANFKLSFSGKDDRFWAGYYGPQVRNPSLTVNYTFDACSVNPLSSPSCSGYADALKAQQCTANPLSDASCPGYQTAKDALCSANPLNDASCPGYAAALKVQQCTANPLSDPSCPGYEQAYLNAQCIKDSLYSTKCEGYKTAYAIKYLVPGIDSSAVNSSLSSTAATKANDPANTVAQPNSTVSTTAPTTSVSSDGTVSTGVSKTGNSAVDNVITPPSTTSVSPAAPNSVVQNAPPPAAPNNPAGPAPQQSQQAKQDEKPSSDKPQPNQQAQSGPPPQQQGGPQPQGNSAPQPTARQVIAERREEQRKMEEMKQGREMAENMKAATSMEQQRAAQGLIISAMAFNPAFDVYKQSILFDAAGYKPYSVYGNQRTIDNARLGRSLFGPNDRLHNEMVESQYNKGN